jgi:uncharacterized DUF497 family protein
MGDFSGMDKRVRRPFETVEESMRFWGCEPTREGFMTYIALLESGDISPPLGLRGDEVSPDGECEWDKKKAFINLHKHGVSFRDISPLFSEKPPPGFWVLYDDPNDDGDGLESVWGHDIRDKVVAAINGQGYYLIKVDRDHVHSGRVRLISVWKVSKKVVDDAIRAHEINSSVSVLARVILGSFGRSVTDQAVLVEMNRRVQAYENIRYLTASTKRL